MRSERVKEDNKEKKRKRKKVAKNKGTTTGLFILFCVASLCLRYGILLSIIALIFILYPWSFEGSKKIYF